MSEIPTVIAPSKEFKKLQDKLDKIEERVENTNAEIIQRVGKKAGRDVGIVYGFVIGFTVLMVLGKLLPVLQKFVGQ